jgi:hypothetical protein
MYLPPNPTHSVWSDTRKCLMDVSRIIFLQNDSKIISFRQQKTNFSRAFTHSFKFFSTFADPFQEKQKFL